MKKFFGLIGYPLKHTLSDQIHEYLFNLNGVDASYSIIEIIDDKLEKEVNNLRNSFCGFNVTYPYKTKIIRYLDGVDIIAQNCESVNLVLNKRGKLIGYNTDIFGFEKSVKLHNIPLSSKVCILGFGGAGKTISYYLLSNNVDVTVAIRNYSKEKVNKIKNFNKNISVIDISYIDKYRVLINTTPVGMFPNVDQMAISEKFLRNIDCVYDIIYNPPITKLMKSAINYGCKVFNGESMLMWQAIKAQQIWLQEYSELL